VVNLEMLGGGAGDLWMEAAARVRAARGWSLRPVARLGQPRTDRATWLADGEPGMVVVKALANPFAPARAAWVAQALAMLSGRGYPVPRLLWSGTLAQRWWLIVQAQLPGEPLRTLDHARLDELLELVELQADPGLGPGGWDISWWIGVVLFDGWEHWWEDAEAAAPATCQRLRAFLEPASGHRLPVTDLVHGNLNLSNVLTRNGTITGVVDWDDMGVGTRATDLAGLLFDWCRLRLAGQPGLAADGARRLVGRIVELTGEPGLRCTVTYGAVARLGLSAQRGDQAALTVWRRVTDGVLDGLHQRPGA
jgi:hypothetical protein